MFIKFCQKEADTNISTQRDMNTPHENTLSKSAQGPGEYQFLPDWAGNLK